MPRLIHTELSAPRQSESSKPAPRLILKSASLNALPLHFGHEGLDVGAHQEELMNVIPVRWVNCYFGRRQPKDEPPSTDIDVRELERVAQECAVRLGVGAVDNDMETKRLTRAQANVHSTNRMTARVKPCQIEPLPLAKLRARFPASAMDNGSHAAAAASAAKAAPRSTEPAELRRTGSAAVEASPIAARALPAGSPPGSANSR